MAEIISLAEARQKKVLHSGGPLPTVDARSAQQEQQPEKLSSILLRDIARRLGLPPLEEMQR